MTPPVSLNYAQPSCDEVLIQFLKYNNYVTTKLLASHFALCTNYTIKMLYFSSVWIRANASVTKSTHQQDMLRKLELHLHWSWFHQNRDSHPEIVFCCHLFSSVYCYQNKLVYMLQHVAHIEKN